MAGLTFGGMFGDNRYTAVGYRSPESGQDEVNVTHTQTQNGVDEVAYTVPGNKTLYVTEFTISDGATINNAVISTGDGDFFFYPSATAYIWAFGTVPMEFKPGTVISFRCDGAGTLVKFKIVGFLD